MSERPPVLDFPLSLFREVTETLASHCDITVIGSFALLEHVDVTSWDQLHTSDIDLLLYLAQSDEVDAVSRSMRELGFMRPNGRNGKWIRAADAAVVDLVSRTCPTGYGPPACLDEPFANVAYLDRQRANRLGAVCDLLPTTAVSVSGRWSQFWVKPSRFRATSIYRTGRQMSFGETAASRRAWISCACCSIAAAQSRWPTQAD